MKPQHFRYDETDGVALIRLDRPERLNALTFASYRELTDAFRALQTRASVRSVVLTGTGKAFCSGGDVEDIIGALLRYDAAQLNEFTRLTCDLIQSMRELEKPIVAALNGTTCGAGAVMAAAADIRIAAESAKIAFLFVKVGLSGADMGAAWLLPRIVGLGHASELLMTGKFIDARRAEAIGLYNRVVALEELDAQARALALELAAGPALGLQVTKRMLNAEASMTLPQAMQAEGWIQALCMEHPDFKEGFGAAMQKRPPRFDGAPLPMQAPRQTLSSASANERAGAATSSAAAAPGAKAPVAKAPLAKSRAKSAAKAPVAKSRGAANARPRATVAVMRGSGKHAATKPNSTSRDVTSRDVTSRKVTSRGVSSSKSAPSQSAVPTPRTARRRAKATR